jgi:hypothetical protein
MRRFAYFYLMNGDDTAIDAAAPAHAAYWHGRGLTDYRGGPFEDRSGGLITFSLEDGLEGEDVVAGDPFVRGDLLSARWLKEWIPVSTPAARSAGMDPRFT